MRTSTKNRLRRHRRPGVALIALLGIGLVISCEDSDRGRLARPCEPEGCGPMQVGWEVRSCPARSTVTMLATTPDGDVAGRRDQRELVAGLLRSLALPDSALSVVVPLGGRRLGPLLYIPPLGISSIAVRTAPPAPPNGSKVAKWRSDVQRIEADAVAACDEAWDSASSEASDAVAPAVARVASGTGIARVPSGFDGGLDQIVVRASMLYERHPAARRQAVLASIRLDAAVPPGGLAGNLEGAAWVLVYEPSDNPGKDRLRRDRIAGGLKAYGIRVTWLARGMASPPAIAEALAS